MNFPENEALKIATQIVVARLQDSNISVDASGGQSTAAYFKAVYEGIKEIVSSANK